MVVNRRRLEMHHLQWQHPKAREKVYNNLEGMKFRWLDFRFVL
jgi:hypothetical protein